ncbi:MAG: sulfite exporter TauE/SafE family protein [Woeseiaceae bacterium]|jgi:nickel/cobalt transporter (NicO) family protein|nr:sulfite exporter TauE/SafE family protein [Woeseiaceae bacterium]MDG1712802.1 sulfite exporter TauE/SafE family protein [Woeseiaceae bacterium]MDG1865265.1 sulfite exporter TauE/SafE family protein [Woeseiaceae bacterium]|tara:strand:- start:1303 stop:2016 length:714 start_codon:yes stop_codon:yes gene_type:complete
MLTSEIYILLSTAAAIAFIHTLIGPDHYLVFVALGKARNWTLSKTLRITSICGIGHVLSSVVIGSIGIFFGAELIKLIHLEETRGILSGWLLLMFGGIYFIWGLKKIGRSQSHTHYHQHGDIYHSHEHSHEAEHMHPHLIKSKNYPTSWALFVIFILGPCEALIPLFMYPAAQNSNGVVIMVATVFGLVTLMTMLLAVFLSMHGLKYFKIQFLEKYSHTFAGASIMLCAGAINFMNL